MADPTEELKPTEPPPSTPIEGATEPVEPPAAKPLPRAPQRESGRGFFRRSSIRSPNETLQPAAPPPPPPGKPRKRRRAGMLSIVSGFLSFLLIACLGAALGLTLAQQKIRSAGPLSADKVLYFPPRTEVPEILAQLEREGVIDSPMLMNVSLWLEGNRGNVKAGEYLFKREASMRDVIDLLVSGRQLLHSITIPEGLTTEQILQRLRENDVLAGDLRETPKEGQILPETYRVPRGMSRSDLVRKMQDDQRKLVEQVWAKRDPSLPLRTPYELVTLASIVEKETGKADERPRVASVFINRLQKRMRLQSDPTIVYGIVGGKGTLGRGITRDEISRPTAYNTYVIDGLPPGPIANPGRAALEATANPAKTKDLYFVADGTGGHVFAETLDEHSRNVARWRQLEREKAGSANVDRAPAVVPGDPGVPNVTPPNVAPPRGQRGALELPGPGNALVDALPRMAGFDLSASFGLKGLVASGPPPATVLAQQINQNRKLASRGKGGSLANFSFESGAERVAIRGLTDRPQLDGGEDDFDMGHVEGGINPESYPVNPRMLAEQHARAMKYGVDSGGADRDSLPPEALALQPVQARSGGRSPIRIYDASEGTALDPLKDKKWDLTSPKNIPVSLRNATNVGNPPPQN